MKNFFVKILLETIVSSFFVTLFSFYALTRNCLREKFQPKADCVPVVCPKKRIKTFDFAKPIYQQESRFEKSIIPKRDNEHDCERVRNRTTFSFERNYEVTGYQ